MTVDEFEKEYGNLTIDRRKDFLRRIFNTISNNVDNESIDSFVIDELIPVLRDFEADDGFGTEGFRG